MAFRPLISPRKLDAPNSALSQQPARDNAAAPAMLREITGSLPVDSGVALV
jgi:hypothetical protein